MYEKENQILIHLVNEIGQRPLMDSIPVYSAKCSAVLPKGKQVQNVRSVIAGESLNYKEEAGKVEIVLDKLEVWDMLSIDLK